MALVGSLTVVIVVSEREHQLDPGSLRWLYAIPAGYDVDEIPKGVTYRVQIGADALALGETIQVSSVRMVNRLLDRTFEPEVVHYTIKSGGTARDVANRFGIFHSAMQALNPNLTLDQHLPAGSDVVVYRKDPKVESLSIGLPWQGELEGGVPMIPGPGRILYAHPFKAWGTASTIARLDYVLRQWAKRYPDAPPILVGNLSKRTGGKVRPHRSHQSGRDVDLSFISHWDGSSTPKWQVMRKDNLDAKRTWDLLQLLVETSAIDVIIIDYGVQKLLYDYAKEKALFTPEQLARWMEYPDGRGASRRIIVHAPGHDDHIHARFKCRPENTRCRSK